MPSPCFAVERVDARARRLENLGVARQRFGRGVAKVAEDREVDVRIDVAERLHLEVREEIARPVPTRSRIVGTITIVRADAGTRVEIEPRQPAAAESAR